MTRPNVLVMIADDHRYSAIAEIKEEAVHTPNLDGLIREGICFDRVYTMGGLTGAVCIPSRACLLTGVNTFDSVVSQNVNDNPGLQTIRPQLPLLPQVFREAGYHTFVTGKWHNDRVSLNRCFADGASIFLGGMDDHFATPIRSYDPTGIYPDSATEIISRHSTDIFADTAIQFLRTYEKAEPFFLYVAFTAPHDPRTPPQEFASLHDPYSDDLDLPPNAFPEHPFAAGDLDIRDELLAPFPRTKSVTRKHLADYYGMISHMDQRIGDILNELQSSALASQTIVLYLSDHGLAVGQHGLMGKQNMYDHSLHIPCIIRGPGFPKGQRSDSLLQHIDVFPTLCAAAGLCPPTGLEGVSMLDGRSGSIAEPEQCILSAYKLFQRCVTSSEFKLIHHYVEKEGKWKLAFAQLFDLHADPFEIRNLAYDPRQMANIKQLRSVMKWLQERYNDPILHTHVSAWSE